MSSKKKTVKKSGKNNATITADPQPATQPEVASGVTIEVPQTPEMPEIPIPIEPTATSGVTSPSNNMGEIKNCTTRDVMTATDDAPVWHRSFDKVEKISLADDSFALNRWEAEKSELLLPNGLASGVYIFTGSNDGKRIGVPFEESYVPFFNSDMREMLLTTLAALEKLGVHPEIVTSGSVKDRSRTFATIRIPEHEGFEIDGRVFKTYMSAMNGFGKNSPFVFGNSNVCICCANTYQAAMQDTSGAFRFAVWHKKNMKSIVEEVTKLVPAAFETSIKQHDEFSKHLKCFAAFPVGLEDAEKVFAWFVGKDTTDGLTTRSANIVERLKELFVRGKGNKGETAFDLFQACTEFYTHESGGESEDQTKQFETSEFGSGSVKKSDFYAALLEMTSAKEKFTAVGHIGNTLLVNFNQKCKDKIEEKIKKMRAGGK